jgi:hypothetical protein
LRCLNCDDLSDESWIFRGQPFFKALASGRQTATDASLRFRQPNAELSSDIVDEGLIRGWLGLEEKYRIEPLTPVKCPLLSATPLSEVLQLRDEKITRRS